MIKCDDVAKDGEVNWECYQLLSLISGSPSQCQVLHLTPLLSLVLIMCSVAVVVLTFVCLWTCSLSESVGSDDVEVFQKIVLPPVLTRKDSEVPRREEVDVPPDKKLGKLYSSYSWNLPKISSKQLSGKYASSWTDRNNPGNEVPTWDVNNYRNGPPTTLSSTTSIPSGLSSSYPYTVTATRLADIRANRFYPFYDQGGNSGSGDYQRDIHASSPQLHKNLNFQLPFFGFRYNYTRISMHGFVEFSDPPEHFTYPLSFPVADWPKKNDPAFIGIFYSKCRIGSIRPTDFDQRAPGVYFRMERDLQARQDWYGIEMRERVKWDIREGVVGASNFDPKHMAIITWKNVSFAGGIDNSLYKTNTFQMVLVTDEIIGYTIFNYREIQWTAHTEAGGDTTGGEGGVPAFIGFNAGNGTRSYEYKPFSQTTAVRDLVSRGWGNNMTGRHIFRIDENILPGSCNRDIAGANLDLVFAPESANMLGGTAINITGPCFRPGMKIKCRFDTEGVDGYVDTSLWPNRAVCIMPFVMAEGYVILDISIDGGAYNWKGKFFVETPATATQYVFFDTDAIHQTNPSSISMRWDWRNLTANANSYVNITLWGYRETTIRPELVIIDILQDSVANSGQLTITPSDYKSRNNYLTSDVRFGFVKIQLIPSDSSQSINGLGAAAAPVMWSRPIPLGWYFQPQWVSQYGNNWASAMCDNWLMDDRYLKNFASDVAQCPCTLSQALIDKGRFMPDFDCDIDRNPQCQYNKGAVHCVKTGSPSMEGSEQQCCYDKNHYLMLSYDQQWGSRPRVAHTTSAICPGMCSLYDVVWEPNLQDQCCSMEGSEQQCCYDKNHYLMLSYDQQWGSRPRVAHTTSAICPRMCSLYDVVWEPNLQDQCCSMEGSEQQCFYDKNHYLMLSYDQQWGSRPRVAHTTSAICPRMCSLYDVVWEPNLQDQCCSMEGSEQQCCYDKNHYLMLSYDQQWGSRPRRSHNLGYLPWNEANKVPTLSQWFHDMSPFYFCCLWQEEQAVGCETFRFERRPTQDCVAYQPPYVATVFGDPHVITFDGLEYTFNGKGEYVLVHVNSTKAKFDVQGRFEQLPQNIYGSVNATQLTSIVARDNTSAVIEVRLRPKHARWRYNMDVFADKKRIYFDRPSLRVQHFPGVTIYQPSYILNQSQIVIMFQSGAGVEVVENKGYMAARVYLPWNYINQTRGLFGVWDFQPTDDLTDSYNVSWAVTWGSGFTISQPTTSFQTVYYFANTWRLEDKEKANVGTSMFLHEYTHTASYYSDPTFVPDMNSSIANMYYSTNTGVYNPRAADAVYAQELCGESFQCQYDYFLSLNRDLAYSTLQYQSGYSQIRSTIGETVITCGILETPRYGRKSNFFFVPGTKVVFECNQGFVLIGDQRRTCTAAGQWDVPIYGYTECLRMEEYDLRNILRTSGIVVLVFVPLLIVLCCVVNVVVRRIRGEGSSASWRYLGTLDKPRRSSVSKAEVTPLKSAATLADADSALGMSNPPRVEPTTLQKSVAPVTASAPPPTKPRQDTDQAYDGVYYTNEPLPGKPNVDFEDKIWDFDDDDVFRSKSNSSLSSPLSGRDKESLPRPSKPAEYASILKPSQPTTSASQSTTPSPPELPKTLPPSPSQIPKDLLTRSIKFSGPPPLPTVPPPQSPQKRLPTPLVPARVSTPSDSSTGSSPKTPVPSPASSNNSGSDRGVRVNKSSISTAI